MQPRCNFMYLFEVEDELFYGPPRVSRSSSPDDVLRSVGQLEGYADDRWCCTPCWRERVMVPSHPAGECEAACWNGEWFDIGLLPVGHNMPNLAPYDAFAPATHPGDGSILAILLRLRAECIVQLHPEI